ncbi:MAG: hypothetical protein ACE5EA_00570 [Nitrospirota bacterium]
MDFKKLSIFIIILGAIVLAYGGIQYVINQPVKFDRSKSKKTVFGGFEEYCQIGSIEYHQ